MPTPKNNLKITRINEISFVDKGDNPQAGAVILKAAPLSPPGGPLADTPIVEKALEERLAKAEAEAIEKAARLAKAEERLAKMEEAEALTAIVKALPPGVDASLANDLRTVQKASHEAYNRISAELVKLAKQAAAVSALTTRIGSVGKTAAGSARAALDAEVAKVAAAQNCSEEEALQKVCASKPDLYAAARAEE